MGRKPLPPEQRKPRLSGAQRRKLKYEQAEREVAAGAGRTKSAPTSPPKQSEESEPEGDGKWAEEFKEAGMPDLENPETDLSYVRKLQLICLRQTATRIGR